MRAYACVCGAAVICLGALFSAAAADGETGQAAEVVLTDYDDYCKVAVRNADLLRMIDEAALIVVAQFKLSDVPAPVDGMSKWTARVPDYSEGVRSPRFKGNCGREITIEGDPKAFENPATPYISERSFLPRDQFLLFLKPAGEDGVYRCVDMNGGGFRFYRGRESYDTRAFYVGTVGGRRVVEAIASRYGRMTGPMRMIDVLQGLPLGVKLTAKAMGDASVELRLENTSKRPVKVPQKLDLVAPLLWAEIEDGDSDRVLLSRNDYLLLKEPSPWDTTQALEPSNSATFAVELPTGPVPEGADLTWAHCIHYKPLAGSLPEGEHAVRFICYVTKDDAVISNTVVVRGRAGVAGPAQIAAIEKPSPFVAAPPNPPANPLPPLRAEDLRGEIWFDSNRDGSWDIFVMNADGSNAVNVTKTPDKDEFSPAPSPDGKRVAFIVSALGTGGGNVWNRWKSGGRQVWVMDRDGQNARKLADDAVRPDWWPDGKAVVYGGPGPRKKGGFCVHNIETGEVIEPLAKVESWLNVDGAGGAFCPAARGVVAGGGTWRGGGLVAVRFEDNYEFKDFTALTTTYHGCAPQWFSKDLILFAHHDPKFNGAIIRWSIRPDGTEVRRFMAGKKNGYQWPGYGMYCESPDGTMMAHSCWGDIIVVRLADGAEVQLTKKQGQSLSPYWRGGPAGK